MALPLASECPPATRSLLVHSNSSPNCRATVNSLTPNVTPSPNISPSYPDTSTIPSKHSQPSRSGRDNNRDTNRDTIQDLPSIHIVDNNNTIIPQPSKSISSYSNNETTPLVSDASESQMIAPASDFAFYEWDFKDDTEANQATETAAALGIIVPNTHNTATLSVATDLPDSKPSQASIEELMVPSIYKSRLSTQVGASELNSEMFGGIETDASTETLPPSVSPPAMQLPRHHSTVQQASSFQGPSLEQVPEEMQQAARERRRRHHTVDVTREGRREHFPRRRSRTLDFHDNRAGASTDTPTRRDSADAERGGGGFLRLLSRFSASSKKKKPGNA